MLSFLGIRITPKRAGWMGAYFSILAQPMTRYEIIQGRRLGWSKSGEKVKFRPK